MSMTQTQQQNVPALRFPEFSGEWLEERFENSTLSIKSGRSTYQKTGAFPVYGSTGQIGYSDKYEFEQPAILVARVGANAGRINKAKGKYGVTDNTLAILLNEHNDFDFAVSLLEKTNLNRFVFGSGQPLITGTMLKRIKCTMPTLPEQQKIASFLSSVDRKIAQLGQKKALLQQYKKGMMQKLFSQELRFKDVQGNDFPDWEEKRLGEVLTIGSGRDHKHLSDGNIPVYGTGGYMRSVDKYLHNGESVCIGRKGTIDKPVYLEGKFWTVDTLFFTHSFKSAVPKFIYAVFQSINWKKHNEASGVPSLSKTTIEKIRNSIPSVPEQQKIADFLSSIDQKIDLVATELNHAKTFKKGLLQQMFI